MIIEAPQLGLNFHLWQGFLTQCKQFGLHLHLENELTPEQRC